MHDQSRLPLPDVLKQSIRATGKSVNSVARASGVSQPILQRFLAGKRGITLDTAERLCVFLKLELREVVSDAS